MTDDKHQNPKRVESLQTDKGLHAQSRCQAALRFQNAEYDGLNDVVVDSSPEWINEHTLAINASGEAILFIEFGTGVYNPVTHPKADELGMIRGAYGKGYGQNYTWYYRGVPGTNGEVLENGKIKTHGNNANRCMWDASEEMRRKIYDSYIGY